MRVQILNKVFVIFVIILKMWSTSYAAPPFTLTLDCGSKTKKSSFAGVSSKSTLCDCIGKALPEEIKNGKFVLQNAPKAQISSGGLPNINLGLPAPRLEAMSSAERLEELQKGVEKLMRAVNVFDKLDQYLSDRTRIIVSKLAKVYED